MSKKYYVTKYAAAKGIITVEADTEFEQLNGSFTVEIEGKPFTLGKDVFEILDDARKDAIRRTRRKVTALFKKEENLEAQIGVWESELPV